jgi:signal transduction histidine kinase
MPTLVDGRLHVLGWVQPSGSAEVRGVEVELAALISRLGGALPAEPVSGEGYALRDEQGRVLHQAGAVERDATPVLRVPFAAALLPGWDVTAYLTTGSAASGNRVGFFWISVLLVAIFVAAILAGGSLLLWQARRSEEEAAQKTSFVANVSHEFKTPLTTIRLYSELLEQGRVRDKAQGGEYLRTIGRETQRLARLVNNALDFSRLEQGRKKYAREAIDLAAELARLLETHAPRVAEAGLVLKREPPAEPIMVTTDRDALEQIVLNLIDNACKYAIDGGEVTVAVAARPEGGAEIRVSDRGPGVPLEHRERIFEKFHRIDDALTAEKTGAGLGLSIARQLARGLGGELRYEARSGAGAEFVLELP